MLMMMNMHHPTTGIAERRQQAGNIALRFGSAARLAGVVHFNESHLHINHQ